MNLQKERLMPLYNIEDWSNGVELEYGNFSVKSPLPEGAKINTLDNTVVSSTGIANDPKGELYEFGGEINTKPCFTIDDQINHIEEINRNLCPTPLVNYRSNLHIHIRVPGLIDDLASLKKFLRYVVTYQEQAFDIVEQIPVPDPRVLSPEVYEWALKRMKRRKKSHQHKLPQKRIDAMLAAKTPQEFYEEHAHRNAKGEPAWFQCPRAGINIRQLFEETQTIEFRHFPGTTDLYEMKSCIQWCYDFMDAALNHEDRSPMDIFNDRSFVFPKFGEYEFETEQLYQYTNFDKNNRSTVKERLEALRSLIDIDDVRNVKSTDVYPMMLKLQAAEGVSA